MTDVLDPAIEVRDPGTDVQGPETETGLDTTTIVPENIRQNVAMIHAIAGAADL